MPHNWLIDLLSKREELESPKKFWEWSLLCAISAVVKRNVYLRKKDARRKVINYILYPNIYVFLIGDSANVRKGPPVKMARKLVRAVNNTRIISGRSSIQGIITQLATASSNEDGSIINDSACFICASELRSSLIDDPQAIAILTDLHDGDFADEWKILLKGTGVQELKDVYITILGGSNPAYLKKSIQGADVEGGIIGRSFLVYGSTRQTINSLTGDTEGEDEGEINEDEQYKKEAEWLIEVSKLKGKFLFSIAGAKFYNEWYHEFTVKEISDRTGTFGRLHDQILKVAMLLSLSEKAELLLTKDNIEKATIMCMELAGDVSRSIMPVNGSEFSQQAATVLQELLTVSLNGKEISRQRILSKFYGDVDYLALDKVVENLQQQNSIHIRSEGRHRFYKLTQSAISLYRKFEQQEED